MKRARSPSTMWSIEKERDFCWQCKDSHAITRVLDGPLTVRSCGGCGGASYFYCGSRIWRAYNGQGELVKEAYIV